MNTCVVRPFATAKAKASVPRWFVVPEGRHSWIPGIVGEVGGPPCPGDRGVAVDAELRKRSCAHAKDGGVVVVAVLDECEEPIDGMGSPCPPDLEADDASRRIEIDAGGLRGARAEDPIVGREEERVRRVLGRDGDGGGGERERAKHRTSVTDLGGAAQPAA